MCIGVKHIVIYYKETLEKKFEIPIDKLVTRWYHIITEREKEIQKGTFENMVTTKGRKTK